jgi:hypothetical protein
LLPQLERLLAWVYPEVAFSVALTHPRAFPVQPSAQGEAPSRGCVLIARILDFVAVQIKLLVMEVRRLKKFGCAMM